MASMLGRDATGFTEDPDNEVEAKEWGIFGEKRSKWSEQRAIIVNKPSEPVVCRVGELVFVPIEVQNSTKWPWKRGCVLSTSPKQSIAL